MSSSPGLGVKVFDRTSRRVRLTPAGERLRRNLQPALAAPDQVLAETSELSRAGSEISA
jgi:DNA-binding transcriptional LysR family regulator